MRSEASLLALNPEDYIAGTLPPRRVKSRKTRKASKADWVRFPVSWREVLHQAGSAGTTYDLAITILFEAFKYEYIDGEIVLSEETAGMPRNTRRRAIKELVELGLIKVRGGKWKGL